jgi:hypothetical protein
MNEALFNLMARAFDGVATIGNYSAGDGHLTVHVYPSENGTLPDLGKVHQAIAIGDSIEERLGIVISVKVHDQCPMLAIA